jgi:uncharacterized lipoprotein YehR (DUF1307 family)
MALMAIVVSICWWEIVRENQEEELHKFKQQMSETQASLDYLHKHNSLLLQKKENREKLISTLMAGVNLSCCKITVDSRLLSINHNMVS